MSLLIKLDIFEEALAKFYIAELTCAIESVHKMGFIHRLVLMFNARLTVCSYKFCFQGH